MAATMAVATEPTLTTMPMEGAEAEVDQTFDSPHLIWPTVWPLQAAEGEWEEETPMLLAEEADASPAPLARVHLEMAETEAQPILAEMAAPLGSPLATKEATDRLLKAASARLTPVTTLVPAEAEAEVDMAEVEAEVIASHQGPLEEAAAAADQA